MFQDRLRDPVRGLVIGEEAAGMMGYTTDTTEARERSSGV